ncbi:MAG TPA: glycosyltransferase family 4 protein [Solirubrobacterales bacterium]|jgi:glycosyltransferase involved in cell wall biosynthesis|nr:glycosyltransferase family 4 protein [Solirubrobacterales bacterium]
MRILLVLPMVPQADGIGGFPKLLHAELSGLRERHELTLVGTFGELPGQAEAAAALVASGLDAHFVDRRRSPSAARRWRVRLELASSWATSRRPWRAVTSAGGVQSLLDRVAASRRFDLVAIEDSPMSALRFPAGVPTVLTEHEAFRAAASDWRAERLSERPIAALRRIDWARWGEFQAAAWQRFDLTQVFCPSDAEAIRSRRPELSSRVRINPFGIVLPDPVDPAGESQDTVLFVGNFTHLPNRDAALWLAREIMPAVRQRQPGARLRIVGSALPREVAALAGDGIEVIADAPSIEQHIAAAAVVMAPVRTGGGMRIKVLEALARGKAVVTTSRGAEGYTGFGPEPPLIIADDPGAIAEATADLLADTARRRELGARASEFARRHYSPSAWAERLEAVYEEARELG